MRLQDLDNIDLKKLSRDELLQLQHIVRTTKQSLLKGFVGTVARTDCVHHLSYKRPIKNPEQCTCLECLGGKDTPDLLEWHRRLYKNKMDNNAKRYIIQMEKDVVDKFDKQREHFLEVLLKIYKEKGLLGIDDINKVLFHSVENVSGDSVSPILYYSKYISDSAKENAYRRLGYDREGARKMVRKSQYDPEAVRLQEMIDKSMSKVRTIPQDVTDKMKDMWMEMGSPVSIVHDLVGQEEERIRKAPLSDSTVRNALADLYNKQRHVFQRIVRTESINLYAKVQLQEWKGQGVKEVERHSIGDERTCLLCRELSAPGRNIYLLDDLLKQQYPVSFISHPNCRCSYTPQVNFSIFDELEQELMATNPPENFDVDRNVQIGEVEVRNLPLEYDEEVQRLIREAPPDSTINFVPDVTVHELWKKDMLEEINKKYPRERDALMALQNLMNEQRGKILTYVTKDLENSIVSGFAGEAIPVTAAVARLTAVQTWDVMNSERKKWFEDEFKKRKDSRIEHKGDGMFYTVTSPFVSPIASEDVQGWFTECFIAYMVNPLNLMYMDPVCYNFLKEGFFSKEYLDNPVRG